MALNGIAQDVLFYRENTFWNTVGFSIYTFEGIGVIMPIMEASAVRKDFPKIFIQALIFLTMCYISFGLICYFTYGDSLNEPIVLNMLPSSSWIVLIAKVIFAFSLICTFPLSIYPVNSILERYITPKNKIEHRLIPRLMIRIVTVSSCVFLAILMAKKLDKFTSLIGALLCGPIAFTMPALCHLKLVATSV